MSKRDILESLVDGQLKVIRPEYRLSYKDLIRITKNINVDIFGSECCLWDGYVNNLYNPKKGRYINFYFNKKKRPLHRLIYNNFVGELNKGEYVKYNCCNNGYCINIKHFSKVFNNIPDKNIKNNYKNNYKNINNLNVKFN